MNKFYKRIFKRNDNKNLFIYSKIEHTEKSGPELESNLLSYPHLRWHPLRQEWITYAASRENRTAFPPKEYCPLCPGGNLEFPTEIPFKNFDIAVFPNRWPSFKTHKNNFDIVGVETKPSIGICEVVVYSEKHDDTIADMPLDHIQLLVQTWKSMQALLGLM